MCEAQQRAPGRFIAIGFQWSFSRAIQRLKADILAGKLGRPLTMRSLVLFPRGDAYYARNRWAGRLATDEGQPVFDSPVNNAAAHYLHNMLYLLGHDQRSSITPVHLQAELYRANPIENYDTAILRMMTSCGAEVQLVTSHATGRRVGPQFRFKFERAIVTYGEEAPHDHVIARFNDGRIVDYGAPETDRDEKLWQCIAAARDGGPVACDVAAALPHALCVDAARRSFESPVTIPASQILRRPVNGGSDMSVVVGLEDALLKCHRLGASLSELRIFRWARAGNPVQPRDCAGAAKSPRHPQREIGEGENLRHPGNQLALEMLAARVPECEPAVEAIDADLELAGDVGDVDAVVGDRRMNASAPSQHTTSAGVNGRLASLRLVE
jgi:hypothetical protein